MRGFKLDNPIHAGCLCFLAPIVAFEVCALWCWVCVAEGP